MQQGLTEGRRGYPEGTSAQALDLSALLLCPGGPQPPSAPGGQPATPVRARLSLPPSRISIINNRFISAHGRFHSMSGLLVKSPRCLPCSSNLVDVTPNRSSQHQLDTLLSPLSGQHFLLGFLESCSSRLTSGPAGDLRGDRARCRGICSVWLF